MLNLNYIEAFLDGVTGAGLFGKLRWPGAPTELIDSRSVEEFLASGEFDRSMGRLGYHRVSDVDADAAPPDMSKIHIIGRHGAVGILSADGETVTWYVDGHEVSGAEIVHSAHARDYTLVERVRRSTGSYAIAAEQMHEHAGRG
jgi:hypothetical protein